MSKDYQSTPLFYKKPITINLPTNQVINFESRCKKLGMTHSQFVIYLMEEYDGDNLTCIINFRYNLERRLKKGINKLYINQLQKLQKQLNLILEKL